MAAPPLEVLPNVKNGFFFVCGLTLVFVGLTDVEPEQDGTRNLQLSPVVYRTWKNTSDMPVPRAQWLDVGFRVVDYDDEEARKLAVDSHLGDLWDAMPSSATQADLFRLLVLLKYGGWYADADVVPRLGLEALAFTHDLVFFNEACGLMWWNRLKYRLGISSITRAPQYKNSLFAAPRGWRPLRAAILLMERNVETNKPPWTKAETIEATGPGQLTYALSLFPDELKHAKIVKCRDQPAQFVHLGMRTWWTR
tara:strand:+ start:223 stop:978 length:756 start_codon:yes stop_codon:yes gene_type:complete